MVKFLNGKSMKIYLFLHRLAKKLVIFNMGVRNIFLVVAKVVYLLITTTVFILISCCVFRERIKFLFIEL